MDIIGGSTAVDVNLVLLDAFWVCYSTFRTLLCRCSFSIKYVKYDGMVNKK